MIHICDNEVNNIVECNLLHHIINFPKRARKMNHHYFSILRGYINTRKDRDKFKKFKIILDGCSFRIVMTKLVEKLHPEIDAVMLWQTQAINITTYTKVDCRFYLTYTWCDKCRDVELSCG